MTQISVLLNDFGLFLDLLGAVFIFFFGIAPAINRSGAILLSTGESSSEKLKAQKYDFLARLGVFSLVLGFILQIVSNHIHKMAKFNEFAVWTLSILLLACLYLVMWRISMHRKRQVVFAGQYFPQYKIGSNAHEHLWIFIIQNGTKNQINPELHLPQQVTQIDIMQQGKQIRSVKDTNQTSIKNIGPNGKAIIRIWNLAAIPSVALDTYIVVSSKTIQTRILNTIDYD